MTTTLGDALMFAGVPVRIARPSDERFLTLKVKGGGAVQRAIKAGKTPVPFTGYRVKGGQFIYSRIDARNGAFGIVPKHLEGAVVSKDFPVFEIRKERIIPAYLIHLMRSGLLEQDIRASSFGATNRQRITEERLLSFAMPLPPFDEQRRIIAVLDHADAHCTKRRRALTHLHALTQSSFIDMFGDPVTNPRRLPRKKLSELGRLDRGVSRHRPRNDPALLGGPYPLIQTGDVASSGGYIREFTSTYSELGLSQSKIWPAGTLCITIAANIAKTGVLAFDACFPDSVVGFTSDESTTTFVRVWLSFLQATLEASAPQSAQKNINLAILRGLDVSVPDRPSMADFARRVDGIRRLEVTQRRAVAADDSLFASLQSRAFRGDL